MNTLCYFRSLLYVEPSLPSCSSYSLALFLPSAAAQTNSRSTELACVSPPAFLFSKPNILVVSTGSHKTLCFLLRMFWMFLNLWIFLNLPILKCDFQNKSILQIGSDSTRTAKPSPVLTWTLYLSECSLGLFSLLRFCSNTLGSCWVCGKQKVQLLPHGLFFGWSPHFSRLIVDFNLSWAGALHLSLLDLLFLVLACPHSIKGSLWIWTFWYPVYLLAVFQMVPSFQVTLELDAQAESPCGPSYRNFLKSRWLSLLSSAFLFCSPCFSRICFSFILFIE